MSRFYFIHNGILAINPRAPISNFVRLEMAQLQNEYLGQVFELVKETFKAKMQDILFRYGIDDVEPVLLRDKTGMMCVKFRYIEKIICV